jgi:cytochrome c5
MKRLIQTMMMLASLSLFAQTSNVVLPQDKGPDKIDVGAYPAAQQAAYKVFTSKCSKCHTIARPINTMMTRDEWERYVKRMMHKPNSGISDAQGKEIFDFLVFDQAQRKDKNPKAFFPALSDEEIEKLKKQ